MPRKNIPRKIRFEVFKRDMFTCQYCGRKAPDVVLEIDHIEPISKGGTDSIMNLVTSCNECNSGKSDNRLDEKTVIEKKRKQLEFLQERRNQIEMLFEWERELLDQNAFIVEKLSEFWKELTRIDLTEEHRKNLNNLLKKYNFSEIVDGMKTAVVKYFEGTEETNDIAFQKISGICYCEKERKQDPEMFQMRKIIYSLRKKFSYFDTKQAFILLQRARDNGMNTKNLRIIAAESNNWTDFSTQLEEFIEDTEGVEK